MFCSAAGIWDTPLLIIMKWRKGKSLLLEEGKKEAGTF